MAYATKYQLSFLSRKGKTFRVDLQLKDYTDGTITQLTGAPDPFLLNYESGDDSIINPIRASECTINFYNDGATPLTEFYSEDDEAWKIIITNIDTNQILWAGFVVQDDCREIFQDPPHVIQLKGTDNLALLKDITFDEAWNDAGFKTLYMNANNQISVDANHITVWLTPPVGAQLPPDLTKMDFLSIDGIMYTIAAAQWVSPQIGLRVNEQITQTGTYTANWILYDADPIIDKLSLFRYVQTALMKTGIVLPLNIYSNIYENSETDRSANATADMFKQSHLFSGMFLNDDGVWDNCYDILEKILTPLNATLQQAKGTWEIIRWPELRINTNNGIRGTAYDATFANPAAITLAPNAQIAIGSSMVLINADAETRILRPFKNVKFTFNYQQPKELIKNINLKYKGNLLGENSVVQPDGSTNIIRNYELPYWYPVNTTASGAPDSIYLQIFLTIAPGAIEEVEQDRYIVIEHGNYGGPWLQSSSFYLTQGDRVNISFSLKTIHSNPGDAQLTFLFQTDDGTDQYKINWKNGTTQDGSWATNGGAKFIWTSQQDLQTDWTTFSVQSLGVPVNGYFSIMLNQADNKSSAETFYKDFNIEYIALINGSLRITGQKHTTTGTATNKNVLEQEINIDDSPKGVFAGALFTSAQQPNGEYLTLTKAWHRAGITETRKLGEITTMEREQIQSTSRTILEGTVDYTDPQINILNVLQVDSLPNLNFIFGITEFNFMEAQFKATLWEIHKGETDATMDYKFDYIYEQT